MQPWADTAILTKYVRQRYTDHNPMSQKVQKEITRLARRIGHVADSDLDRGNVAAYSKLYAQRIIKLVQKAAAIPS